MPSDKRKFGDVCETIAVKHLVKQGLEVLAKNYLRKWGEIDIIVKNSVSRPHTIHFIEVKGSVLRETGDEDNMPENNVHQWKQKRIWRAIQTWLAENDIGEETEWQIDVIAVFLNQTTGESMVRWTKNIIIE